MKWRLWILMLMIMFACKEKYVVSVPVPPSGFLVVEGFINVNGITNIMMSRASSLDSPVLIPERDAKVEVQSVSGVDYLLTEQPGGHYTIDSIPGVYEQQYRLHIQTSNGKEYLSDLTDVKITPQIDSLNWIANPDNVTIYVTTHDDNSQPGYYQWQFEETWRYSAKYNSNIEYKNGQIIDRPESDRYFVCWRSALSTTISIANTEKLSSNVIYEFPVNQISYFTSDKLIDRYSILVKQVALTKDWYDFNLKMRRNTEQLGTIFDAQPSQTNGNIHSVSDPSEAVIGFIGSTTQTVKRIFVDRLQIPRNTKVFSGYEACSEYGVGLDPQALYDKFHDTTFYVPITRNYYAGFLVGYSYAGPECVDCRMKGGTTTMPPFWK